VSPLVSVCIPTFQGEPYIEQTIRSVLEQSYKPLELLVLDDGASEQTKDICQRFQDPRLKYIAHPQRLGPKGNWNSCLEHASGEYYKLLPHDDLLMSGALERQVHYLDSQPDTALVFGAREIIGPGRKKLLNRKPLGSETCSFGGFDLVRQCIRSGSNIIGEPGNGLMRTLLARQIGSYDDSLPYVIDLDFWFKALARGKAYYTGETESAFRVHNTSWSANIGKAQYQDFAKLIEKYSQQPLYGIDKATQRMGRFRARLNSAARRWVFKIAAKG